MANGRAGVVVAAGLVGALAFGTLGPAAHAAVLPAASDLHLPACTGDPSTAARVDFHVAGAATWAGYVLPATAPRAIIVYGHGYSGSGLSDRRTMASLATTDHALVIAPDFRGTKDAAGSGGGTRGWPSLSGAQDMVAVAEAVLAECRAPVVISTGGSMGGGISGLAVGMDARRPDGRPLFDYWVPVSGVVDLVTNWATTSLATTSGASPGDVPLVADTEAETGGTPFDHLGAYLDRSVVAQGPALRAAHLRGVVQLHAVADTLSPDQPVSLLATLQAEGIPTETIVGTTAAPGEDSESIDRDLFNELNATVGTSFDQQVLAGHVGTALWVAAANRIAELLAGDGVHNRRVTVDAGSAPLVPLG